MTIATFDSLKTYCEQVARRAKVASMALLDIPTDKKNAWLQSCAEALIARSDEILKANANDLRNSELLGLTPAEIDRLTLTASRISAMASGLQKVATLPDPIGECIEKTIGSHGIAISKVRVPLGVIFFIYESRPNVTIDAAAICVKSGNAVVLRGGKEASQSSQVLVEILREQCEPYGIPADAVQLIETSDREVIDHLLKMPSYIDLVIPRGGKGLIKRVSEQAQMPVLKHYDGNCHVYVDRDADLEMAVEIIVNSKCQRMGVCNACESLLVHRDIASRLFDSLVPRLQTYAVEIRGDKFVCDLIPMAVPASEEDWSQEYLGPVLSVKVVESVDEAIVHINQYGSHHTDAIVTSIEATAEKFLRLVDSSAVMWNASTRFNDGGEFGMGAEIGISTDKFHARGPCGLQELTTYKYLVRGSGQVRS